MNLKRFLGFQDEITPVASENENRRMSFPEMLLNKANVRECHTANATAERDTRLKLLFILMIPLNVFLQAYLRTKSRHYWTE